MLMAFLFLFLFFSDATWMFASMCGIMVLVTSLSRRDNFASMLARSILTLDSKCPHHLNGWSSNSWSVLGLQGVACSMKMTTSLQLSKVGHVSYGGCDLKRHFTKKDLAKGENKNEGSTSWQENEMFTCNIVQVQTCDYTCIHEKSSWRGLLSSNVCAHDHLTTEVLLWLTYLKMSMIPEKSIFSYLLRATIHKLPILLVWGYMQVTLPPCGLHS